MISFFKKKNTKEDSKKQALLKVIVKLQQFRIGDPEQLDDIQLDLEEGIPLTEAKVKYLRNSIKQFKETQSKTMTKTPSKVSDKQTVS